MDFVRMFSKFTSQPFLVWVAVASLVILGVVMLLAGKKVKWNARMLAMAALCMSLSFVLSLIRLYRMPQGGSITPGSMLPVMAFGFAFGPLPGLVAGLAYGGLQMLQGLDAVHPVSILLDYPMAFMMLGLAGIFRNVKILPKTMRFPAGVAAAGAMRILMHVISGAVFFYEYAGEQNPWIYSLVYNLTSIGIDTAICCALAFIPKLQTALLSVRGTKS